MVKMQIGRSSSVDPAKRIPSFLRGSVEVCVTLEDILIVFVSCINPNVKPQRNIILSAKENKRYCNVMSTWSSPPSLGQVTNKNKSHVVVI